MWWERDGNFMGTHWGFDENTLGTKENEKKPPSHTPTQKEKTRGNACKASHETSPKASHWLHAISLPNTYHHRCFLPGLMASAEFWGHILMTSTNQLTCGCHCLQQWMKQLFTMGTLIFGFYQNITWLTRVLLGLQNTF